MAARACAISSMNMIKTLCRTMKIQRFRKFVNNSASLIIFKIAALLLVALKLNGDPNKFLKIRQNSKVNGLLEEMRGIFVKDKENKFGQMDQCMRVGGEKTKPMEKEDLSTLMETCMMELGLMIKPMDMVSIAI